MAKAVFDHFRKKASISHKEVGLKFTELKCSCQNRKCGRKRTTSSLKRATLHTAHFPCDSFSYSQCIAEPFLKLHIGIHLNRGKQFIHEVWVRDHPYTGSYCYKRFLSSDITYRGRCRVISIDPLRPPSPPPPKVTINKLREAHRV